MVDSILKFIQLLINNMYESKNDDVEKTRIF